MFTEEHLHAIALRRSALIGDFNFKKLTDAAGSAEAAWKFSKKDLTKIEGIGQKTAADIGNEDHIRFAEKELEFCAKNNIQILLRHKNELPYLLGECEDAPSILYQKGQIDTAKKSISIVGTRNLSSYGKNFIDEFVKELISGNTATISGLALGADAEVHEKSIQNGIPTIGVLAHGFHTFYPSQNKSLSQKMLENGGALLTEFNSSQKPDRENFIQRNRIVAGLSSATIIVETAFGGGSISTATFANGYNRDVYALPGKITDKYSQGCNHLIAQNKAAAISTVKDLILNLNLFGESVKTPELFPKIETRRPLSPLEQSVFDAISAAPNINLDNLSGKMDLPAYRLLPILLELEISGFLKSFSGRQFQVL